MKAGTQAQCHYIHLLLILMDDDTIGRDGYDKDDNGNDNGDDGTFLLYFCYDDDFANSK